MKPNYGNHKTIPFISGFRSIFILFIFLIFFSNKEIVSWLQLYSGRNRACYMSRVKVGKIIEFCSWMKFECLAINDSGLSKVNRIEDSGTIQTWHTHKYPQFSCLLVGIYFQKNVWNKTRWHTHAPSYRHLFFMMIYI